VLFDCLRSRISAIRGRFYNRMFCVSRSKVDLFKCNDSAPTRTYSGKNLEPYGRSYNRQQTVSRFDSCLPPRKSSNKVDKCCGQTIEQLDNLLLLDALPFRVIRVLETEGTIQGQGKGRIGCKVDHSFLARENVGL
jgi:hypothetical protein